jgi:hypothetical protein
MVRRIRQPSCIGDGLWRRAELQTRLLVANLVARLNVNLSWGRVGENRPGSPCQQGRRLLGVEDGRFANAVTRDLGVSQWMVDSCQ